MDANVFVDNAKVMAKKWTDGTVELYFLQFDNGVKVELEKRENPMRYDFLESSFWDPDGNVVEITVDSEYMRACKEKR